MTRVTGKLFEDGRNGTLLVKPSQPFFGCSKQEKSFPVNEGSIDIELLPSPPGIYYFVGFKESGDFRRTEYTLRWRVPNAEEFDITPGKPSVKAEPSRKSAFEEANIKRLTSELATALKRMAEMQQQLNTEEAKYKSLVAKFDEYKHTANNVLITRDEFIASLQETVKPEVSIVTKKVPVPPAPLLSRINHLEDEVNRLSLLNDEYYKSVVELHQLKLDRAHNLPSPGPISTPEDSPRQRLLNKLNNR